MEHPVTTESGPSAPAPLTAGSPGTFGLPLEYGCVDWFDYPTASEHPDERLDQRRTLTMP